MGVAFFVKLIIMTTQSNWYYSLNNQQHGPVSRAELDQILTSHHPAEVLVWSEGMPEWVAASKMETASSTPVTPYASPHSFPVGPVPGLARRRTSGMAITAMVLGIISVLSFGMLILPQILAVVFGHIGMSQCKNDPNMDGNGLAIAGLVMGYIFIGLFLLFFLILMIPVLAL
ncbi:protein of unknown function [Rubritalea squalenifaciens DSM 18772]|uniref:GYF domain-containing protein n=2 Tax=Rubritalea squalenifaciens TaxID=407226 RepID=A0A1M6BCT0_9BACT|nr:protein of unknown function [Rubritalea squalenifaciens DSM 18772]